VYLTGLVRDVKQRRKMSKSLEFSQPFRILIEKLKADGVRVLLLCPCGKYLCLMKNYATSGKVSTIKNIAAFKLIKDG
jgi:valyl-tRNA synthetase